MSEEVIEATTLAEVVHRIREGTFYEDYDWASGPALRCLDAALQSHSQGNAGEVTEAMVEMGAKIVAYETGCVSKGKDCAICARIAAKIYLAMQQASVPPPVMVDEVERLREALRDALGGFKATQMLVAALASNSVMIETFIERIEAALNGGANVR